MSPADRTRRSTLALVASAVGLAGLGALVHGRDETPARSATPTGPTVDWVRRYPGVGNRYALRGRDGGGVVQAAAGGYVLAAEGRSTGDGDPSAERQFALVVIDPDGTRRWSRLVDDRIENTDQNVRDLAPTADGGFLLVGESTPGDDGTPFAGERTRAATAVAFGPRGDRRWGRVYDVPGERNDDARYDPAYDESHFAAVDRTAAGGHVVGGQDSGYEWLVRLAPGGEQVWEGHYATGADQDEPATVVAVVGTGDGGATYVADTSVVRVDPEGSIEWTTDLGVAGDAVALWDLVRTEDGGYAAAGAAPSSDGAGTDVFLATVDRAGDVQWQRRYDGLGVPADAPVRLARGPGDGLALAASTRAGDGQETLAVVGVNDDGTEAWERRLGGVDGRPAGLIGTADGGFALAATGGGDATTDEAPDPVLARLAPREQTGAVSARSLRRTDAGSTGTVARTAARGSPSPPRSDTRPPRSPSTSDGPPAPAPADRAGREVVTDAGGPGFGILVALAALLAGARRHRR